MRSKPLLAASIILFAVLQTAGSLTLAQNVDEVLSHRCNPNRCWHR